LPTRSSKRQQQLSRRLKRLAPKALKSLGREIAQTSIDRALTYTGDDGATEIMPILLAPAVVSKADLAYLHRLVLVLYSAVYKTAEARRTDPAVREILPLGEREERAAVRVGQLGAALVQPVAELGRLRQVKAVEQRAGPRAHDALVVAGRDGGAELVQVAGDVGGVEQEAVAGGRDGAFAQGGAEHVHREVEQAAPAGLVPLGPEQRHGPVARERLRPGGRDERQERQPVPLRRRPPQRDLAGAQARAPKQLDRDHWPLIAALTHG